MKQILSTAILLILTSTVSIANERIISTSSYITQIIVALGEGDQLVGIDSSSRYSDELQKISDIGYRRALSTEGILSLKPTLIFLSSDSGPKNVVDQVIGLGVKNITFDPPKDRASLNALVSSISQTFNDSQKGEEIIKNMDSDEIKLKETNSKRKQLTGLFLMEETGGKGSRSFAGGETFATLLMDLLNINNPFKTHFTSYKDVDIETQVQQNADIVLVGKRVFYQGKDYLFKLREPSSLGWPNAVTPKCLIEIDINQYLFYGIDIYQKADKLSEFINTCIQKGKE